MNRSLSLALLPHWDDATRWRVATSCGFIVHEGGSTANALDSAVSPGGAQHRIATCLELRAALPPRIVARLRDGVSELHQQAQILHGAREVPVGFHLVGWFVIVVRYKVLMFLHTPTGGPADVVVAAAVADGGNSDFRELKVIRSIVVALLWLLIRQHAAT